MYSPSELRRIFSICLQKKIGGTCSQGYATAKRFEFSLTQGRDKVRGVNAPSSSCARGVSMSTLQVVMVKYTTLLTFTSILASRSERMLSETARPRFYFMGIMKSMNNLFN